MRRARGRVHRRRDPRQDLAHVLEDRRARASPPSAPGADARARGRVEQLLLGQRLGGPPAGRDRRQCDRSPVHAERAEARDEGQTSSKPASLIVDVEAGPQPAEPVAELRPGELRELGRRDPERPSRRRRSPGSGTASPASSRTAPAAPPPRHRNRADGRSEPAPRGRCSSAKWANFAQGSRGRRWSRWRAAAARSSVSVTNRASARSRSAAIQILEQLDAGARQPVGARVGAPTG